MKQCIINTAFCAQLKRLPAENINHIFGFIYSTQKPELMKDIREYRDKIYNLYAFKRVVMAYLRLVYIDVDHDSEISYMAILYISQYFRAYGYTDTDISDMWSLKQKWLRFSIATNRKLLWEILEFTNWSSRMRGIPVVAVP